MRPACELLGCKPESAFHTNSAGWSIYKRTGPGGPDAAFGGGATAAAAGGGGPAAAGPGGAGVGNQRGRRGGAGPFRRHAGGRGGGAAGRGDLMASLRNRISGLPAKLQSGRRGRGSGRAQVDEAKNEDSQGF